MDQNLIKMVEQEKENNRDYDDIISDIMLSSNRLHPFIDVDEYSIHSFQELLKIIEEGKMSDRDESEFKIDDELDINQMEIDALDNYPITLDESDDGIMYLIDEILAKESNIFNLQTSGSIKFFELIKSSEQYNEKFECKEFKFEIAFKKLNGTFESHNLQISELFHQLFNFVKTKAKSKDYVGFIFEHPDLNWPIDHPFIQLELLDINNLLKTFESVCQSKRTLRIDENLRFSVIVAKNPVGRGLIDKYVKNSNCLKIVYNTDNMCAIRSILIAKAYADDVFYKTELCKMNSKLLQRETLKMAKALNLENVPCSLKEIAKIEQYLRYYRITVFSHSNCIYRGIQNDKFIYLLYHDNHYSAIVNIKSYFNCSYFCDYCLKSFEHIGQHKCNSICNMCFNPKCLLIDSTNCDHCHKQLRSLKCKQLHQEKFCEKLKECNICGKFKNDPHVCIDEHYCINCKKSVKTDQHRCYVLTEKEKTRKKTKKHKGYIFFDFEAKQENGNHEPNLICALKKCNDCISNRTCRITSCGKFEFKNNDSFCNWLFEQENFIAIAHNMKGYDGVFIMNYIINNILPKDNKPAVIANGSKLLSIRFRKVTIIDSFSFIPIALSGFSSAFGINELKKGHFPHLFNTNYNQKYIGPYPEPQYYGTKFFTRKQLEEFDKWYQSVCDQEFNFQQELRSYCWSDVDLLAAGCLKFRQIIMDLTKIDGGIAIDPFENSITIASLCHLIFRSNHLKPNTLSYIPETGYFRDKNHSFKSLQWLDYRSQLDKVNIQHARNGGEKRFGPYYVDGFSFVTNTIYEFHGCYYHGCPLCFSPETFNTVVQSSMKYLYTRHCNRMKYLQAIPNINIIEIWECQFDKEEIKSQKYVSPLSPRDALFGGRTNALQLYYKIQNNNEKIHYVDFTSLYPYVQKYCRYPIGHPRIIQENFSDPLNYFGIIKCRILPPRSLYIPVLPCKINNKLVFTLCAKCAETCSKDYCEHNNELRAIEGTWVTLEVHKALSLGYKIVEIYEVWDWSESEQYNAETKTGGIFTKYINLFLKGKQESSGFPLNCCSDKEKQDYINEFREKEGIELDIDSICKNPAQRFVFKLFLNSMWGRLGMNTNKTSHKIITKPEEWFSMLQDRLYKIHRVDFNHPDVIQVYYSNLYNEGSTETSVVHAAFVTAHARLKLYSELEKIGNRVLYFDTDSIIYINRLNEYNPSLGNNLGELTNELDDLEDFIVEFVSAGPKNYAYLTFKGKSSCVVKGFRIDNRTNEKINFESIRNIVLNKRDSKIESEQLLFKRNKINWTVNCESIKKLYSFVYDKRFLLDNLSTLPFGF